MLIAEIHSTSYRFPFLLIPLLLLLLILCTYSTGISPVVPVGTQESVDQALREKAEEEFRNLPVAGFALGQVSYPHVHVDE